LSKVSNIAIVKGAGDFYELLKIFNTFVSIVFSCMLK